MKKIPKTIIPKLLPGSRPFSKDELTRQEFRITVDIYEILSESNIDNIITYLTKLKKKHPGDLLLFKANIYDYEGYTGTIDIYKMRPETDEEVSSRLKRSASYKNRSQMRKKNGKR